MVVVINPSEGKPSMGKSIRNLTAVTRVGLDLAKRVFQVHAVEAKGEIVVARKLTRSQLIQFFAELPPGVVAMESGPQPFQPGTSSRHPRNLQTETLGCAARMAHSHGLILT
jgi:hypothetical protein